MTYIAVALVMFILGYLCGALAAAVGVWAEREKAKLVIDGMAEANRGLLAAVGELVAASKPAPTYGTSPVADVRSFIQQAFSSSRGTN